MEVVALLEDENFVHGNLQKTNIMIKKDGSELKVVGFDWAGRAGEVRYPFESQKAERAGGFVRYPFDRIGGGDFEPGDIISKGDNRALVEKWWVHFLT